MQQNQQAVTLNLSNHRRGFPVFAAAVRSIRPNIKLFKFRYFSAGLWCSGVVVVVALIVVVIILINAVCGQSKKERKKTLLDSQLGRSPRIIRNVIIKIHHATLPPGTPSDRRTYTPNSEWVGALAVWQRWVTARL